MKLTIIGLNYAPEPTGIAVYTSGLAEGLASRGVEVHAITGCPHYPQWKVYDGYEGAQQDSREMGVEVRRLRHYVPSRPRLVNRMIMELEFGVRSLCARWNEPDAIVLISPALFSTAIALIRARLQRRPTCVWVQDIYSLGVAESGTGNRLTARLLRVIESRVLRSAQSVVVIHERFRRYLVEELHLDPTRVDVVRNWSHLDLSVDKPRVQVRQSHGWQPEDIVVLHAGNMGAKQGLENVVEAARLASERKSRVRFILLGDGNQRQMLQSLDYDFHLQFVDPLPKNEFMATLLAADILLVNERPGLTEMSVPSKLTSYFSTGLPVIAATDAASVTAEELSSSGGGMRVDAAAPGALVAACERLVADQALAHRLGQAGLAFSSELLSVEPALSHFEAILDRLRFRGRSDLGSAVLPETSVRRRSH